MAIIKITNLPKPVAVALEWHSLAGTTSDSKEIQEITKAAGAKAGIKIGDAETGATVFGVASGDPIGAPCGAAWLAKASRRDSIVLVEPIGGGRIWLCAVQAGLPVPGLDVVIMEGEIGQRLPDFVDGRQVAKICSTVDGIEDLGYPNVHAQSFAELVSGTPAEVLSRKSGVSPLIVIVGVAGLLALGAWTGGTSYLSRLEGEKNASQAAEQSRKAQLEAAEQLRAAIAKHRENGEIMLRAVALNQPTVDVAMEAILSTLDPLPSSARGWELTAADCSATLCKAIWTRSKVGTVEGILGEASDKGWKVQAAAGDRAVTEHPVSADARVASVDDLAEAAPFAAAFESRLQQLELAGSRYELGVPQSIEVALKGMQPPPAAQAPTPAASAAPAEILPWFIGAATIKGKHTFALRGAPSYLEHPAVAIKRVAIDFKANEWILELSYATR